MKNIGIFYHPVFRSRSYLTFRDRLRDFPEILSEVLKKPNVRLYDCPRAPVALILKVHAPEMVDQINREEHCGTAYESVGGVVAAMEALAVGDLDGAFCFTGTEGHHAGFQEFWQSSCFNDVVIAITRVREFSPWRRFAIVDTDAHHGGGTLNLIGNDPDVLHLCFCRGSYRSGDEKLIEVDVYRQKGQEGDNNAKYLDQVRRYLPFVAQFRPDLLIWYFGFDTHRDEYPSLGLTEPAYFEVCDLLLSLSLKEGIPLQVVLGGGSLHSVASATIPEIIRRLAEA